MLFEIECLLINFIKKSLKKKRKMIQQNDLGQRHRKKNSTISFISPAVSQSTYKWKHFLIENYKVRKKTHFNFIHPPTPSSFSTSSSNNLQDNVSGPRFILAMFSFNKILWVVFYVMLFSQPICSPFIFMTYFWWCFTMQTASRKKVIHCSGAILY